MNDREMAISQATWRRPETFNLSPVNWPRLRGLVYSPDHQFVCQSLCRTSLCSAPTTTSVNRFRSLSALLSSGPPEMLTLDQQGSTMAAFGSASESGKKVPRMLKTVSEGAEAGSGPVDFSYLRRCGRSIPV